MNNNKRTLLRLRDLRLLPRDLRPLLRDLRLFPRDLLFDLLQLLLDIRDVGPDILGAFSFLAFALYHKRIQYGVLGLQRLREVYLLLHESI